MGAMAAQVASVRRMTDERTEENYTDEDLEALIEAQAVTDVRGELPGSWDESTEPPTWEVNANWIETYDLHAAAAVIWEEKAAGLAGEYDLTAEGVVIHNSQKYDHAMDMARYHRARRVVGVVRVIAALKVDG